MNKVIYTAVFGVTEENNYHLHEPVVKGDWDFVCFRIVLSSHECDRSNLHRVPRDQNPKSSPKSGRTRTAREKKFVNEVRKVESPRFGSSGVLGLELGPAG